MPSDDDVAEGSGVPPEWRWSLPAPVVTGCLLGCLLPVVAYAEAMSALFGFGIVRRRWAAVLILVPTAVWCYVASRWRTADELATARLSGLAMLLGAQLMLAVLVSAGIARVIARRKRGSATGAHG
jgi:FtsH-binding integral membrane protein